MIETNFKTEELNFEKNGNGLIPAIIQDSTTLKVLMLGYMNREALEKSLAEEKVTFFSRTKNRLWTKGETSGNFLIPEKIFADCDSDTLLVMAKAMGHTCHTNSTSCFHTDDTEGFIRELEKIILQRKADAPEGSYTAKLFAKGVNKIAQKVGEEAVETVIEAVDGNDERLIYEASDLIYHLLVLLASKNMRIADLEKELHSRHK